MFPSTSVTAYDPLARVELEARKSYVTDKHYSLMLANNRF